MTYLIDAAVIFFYAIAACAMCGATIAQAKFIQAAGLPLSTFIRRPWTGMALMADHRKVFAAPGPIKRFVIYGLLLFAAFAALVIGRSIQVGHSPF
ncbi:hypothetical protein [Bradyrhizobium quebecense]|uniref:Uncharacterized protein n=2 Tax=Bradyrhizobium quebecense TaxID=2748629 RepID=A0ACD3V4W1_9BRAD|nr:hypothetical protein [Bradyrhizobium quebecense]UGY01473.1 hypothetical protein J4P68_0030805 [Bradyrhizobium quebecense]